MKRPLKIIFSLALALGLLSIMGFAPEVHSPKERLYAKALQNGDSLFIMQSYSNCFNRAGFSLKLYRKSDSFHAILKESDSDEIVLKTMPLDFKKNLIEFEIMRDPPMSKGMGSNCRTIYKYNDAMADTVHDCPQTKYWRQLLDRIKDQA